MLDIDRSGPRFSTNTLSGETWIWSIAGERLRVLRPPAGPTVSGGYSFLDPSGRRFAILTRPNELRVWDLAGPPDAEPFALLDEGREDTGVSFLGDWLAVAKLEYAVLWPLSVKRSRLLRRNFESGRTTVAFRPDGRALMSVGGGELRLWPLLQEAGPASRTLYRAEGLHPYTLDVDPQGRFAVVARGQVYVVPLKGGPPRILKVDGDEVPYFVGHLDRKGSRIAATLQDEASNVLRIRVWDVKSGASWDLDPRAAKEDCAAGTINEGLAWGLEFLPDGKLLTDGFSGLLRWDVELGTYERLQPCAKEWFRGPGVLQWIQHGLAVSSDGKLAYRLLTSRDPTVLSRLTVLDLRTGSERLISTHGDHVQLIALDPTGRQLLTGDLDGLVRAGPVTGEEPHLLYGHTKEVSGLAVSPDGQWIASADWNGSIWLWPMPQGPPLNTLPPDALLAKLRTLTNLRVVADPASASGYKVDIGPFPGWAKRPEW